MQSGNGTRCALSDKYSTAQDIRSILQASPATPRDKVRALNLLFFGEELGGLEPRLDRSRHHISRVLNGGRDSAPLQGAIAGLFGVERADIWPISIMAPSLTGAGADAYPKNQQGVR